MRISLIWNLSLHDSQAYKENMRERGFSGDEKGWENESLNWEEF
jgi:hypothetical protein